MAELPPTTITLDHDQMRALFKALNITIQCAELKKFRTDNGQRITINDSTSLLVNCTNLKNNILQQMDQEEKRKEDNWAEIQKKAEALGDRFRQQGLLPPKYKAQK